MDSVFSPALGRWILYCWVTVSNLLKRFKLTKRESSLTKLLNACIFLAFLMITVSHSYIRYTQLLACIGSKLWSWLCWIYDRKRKKSKLHNIHVILFQMEKDWSATFIVHFFSNYCYLRFSFYWHVMEWKWTHRKTSCR